MVHPKGGQWLAADPRVPSLAILDGSHCNLRPGVLLPTQLLGLLCLFAGANLVALKDVATGVAAAGGNRAFGIAGLLFAQACTATANVAYEKKLNEPGTDVWVRNVQLTGTMLGGKVLATGKADWASQMAPSAAGRRLPHAGVITFWLVISSAARIATILAAGGSPPAPGALLAAFRAPWVWLVVALKAATAVLIALTLKAGGNVLYAISKPWPASGQKLHGCATWLRPSSCTPLGSTPPF